MIGVLERISLIIGAAGTAMVWLIPYLLGGSSAPEWVVSRWYLLVGVPALLFGALAYLRFGDFAKSPAVLLYSGLVACGCLWTDPTEQGRGLLIATAFVMVVPISALIRKHNYLEVFLTTFAVVSAATMIYAFAFAGSLVLKDSLGTTTTNPNGIGIHAGFAALVALMYIREKSSSRQITMACLAIVLMLFSISTASRTAFLSLGGAILVSLFFRNRQSAFRVVILLLLAVTSSIGISEFLDIEVPFYQGIVSRLIQDEEGTMETLGDRVQIWDVASSAFGSDTNWMHGTGTGGVDKVLGGLYESKGRARGRDGIWRIHAHNTLVWSGLAFGVPGILFLVWLAVMMSVRAIQMDSELQGWEHSALVTYIGIASLGGVITQDGCWCVFGSALLAGLSAPVAQLSKRVEYVLHGEGDPGRRARGFGMFGNGRPRIEWT